MKRRISHPDDTSAATWRTRSRSTMWISKSGPASSTLQPFDGARERRAIRVRKIELIPARDVPGWSLDAHNEPDAQPEPFHQTCGTDQILGDDPARAATLSAKFLQP